MIWGISRSIRRVLSRRSNGLYRAESKDGVGLYGCMWGQSLRNGFLTLIEYTICEMSSHPSQEAESDYRSVPVSVELRDKLRVAKAEKGVSYDEFLKENLSL